MLSCSVDEVDTPLVLPKAGRHQSDIEVHWIWLRPRNVLNLPVEYGQRGDRHEARGAVPALTQFNTLPLELHAATPRR